MPANSTHPDYDATLAAWLRARDVVAGEDVVEARWYRHGNLRGLVAAANKAVDTPTTKI